MLDLLETVKQNFPHNRKVSKDIAKRLGFKAQMLELPTSDNEEEPKKVWILRGPDNAIWSHGQKLIPTKEQPIPLEPALSEDELWERDTADYFLDLDAAFSLLKKIPYHSIRMVTLDQGYGLQDMWEISYRPHPNKATYIELGPFMTILIINVFLECSDEEPTRIPIVE